MEAYTHKRIHELLLKARKPLFIADERIDGDSLGSSLALVDYLKGLGRQVEVFVSAAIPEQYRALPRIEHCTLDRAVFSDPDVDVVVSFDCSDGAYVGELVSRLPNRPIVINIDHHVTNPRYGHVNQVLVDAPATAEVVYRFFRENHIVPSRDAATCLLTGICFDTTAFSNNGTNARSLIAASELIMHGARIQDIIGTMFMNRSVNALRVWGLALGRLETHEASGIVATFITRADMDANDVTEEEVEGLSNFLNFAVDAETLLVLRETGEGSVKASMRSQSRDVASVARAFGGGGHRLAAGFTVQPSGPACDEGGCRLLVERIATMLN